MRCRDCIKDEDGKDRIINAYTELLGVVGDCSLFVDIVDDRSNGQIMIPLGDMGEFNVMIADKKDRRKGYGYYSVLLVLMWCMIVLGCL